MINITLNGEEKQPLNFPGRGRGGSVKDLKRILKMVYPGSIVESMTFNNGEVLSPEVWQTNRYDRFKFKHYADNGVLDGSLIVLTRTVEALINWILGWVLGSVDRYDFERIRRQNLYGEFQNNFRTLDEFLQKQRQYLEEASMNDLEFYETFLHLLINEDVKYMKDAAPGNKPRSFFLMPGGRIILVAPVVD